MTTHVQPQPSGSLQDLKQNRCEVPQKLIKLSEDVQKVALEYLELCNRYSLGASESGLIQLLDFSAREEQLLKNLTLEEKVQYHQCCEQLINQKHPDIHQRAVQSSQDTELLAKFNTRVEVPRDGNCGLHAFAASFMRGINKEKSKRLQEIIQQLINKGTITETVDEQTVLNQLSNGQYSPNDLQFMHALAQVLRKVGHHRIREDYQEKINAMGNSPETQKIVYNLIPLKNGKKIEQEGLVFLTELLIGKERMCMVRKMPKTGELRLTGNRKDPEIVIEHNNDHFTPLLQK